MEKVVPDPEIAQGSSPVLHSLVELGALAGCLPDPLPRTFSEPTGVALERLLAIDFGDHALLLPEFLMARLKGRGNGVVPPPPERGAHLFAASLELQLSIEGDRDVDLFFDLLFDYPTARVIGGYDLNDLLSLARRPAHFLKCLAEGDGENGSDHLGRALGGFSAFMVFAVRLESFLRGLSEHPLLRAAFCNFHCDKAGFRNRALSSFVEQMLDHFARWPQLAGANSDLSQYPWWADCFESIKECRGACQRLTSGVYEQVLWERLERRPPWRVGGDVGEGGDRPAPPAATAAPTASGGRQPTKQAQPGSKPAGPDDEDDRPPEGPSPARPARRQS